MLNKQHFTPNSHSPPSPVSQPSVQFDLQNVKYNNKLSANANEFELSNWICKKRKLQVTAQRTWERAKLAATLDLVVVATDDEKIAECCQGFGAEVITTSESCRNGTERCNEALQKLGKKYDIVVNIQGDEPLIEPEKIDGIVKALQAARGLIPYNKSGKVNPHFPYLLHLGIQSYDSTFLKTYPELEPTPLQLEEDLEQLKVLENGYKMKVIEVDHETHGVDTPEDVDKIEQFIRERNLS
ncbi:hypothetical protein K7X08_012296 [Anisodus acutangulus]|uniref:3-deoxy-manno-octulosonate cytidylyltransferase n=1 Tax=Anisodus acutangulus TaxID=402998 RepID=A0A9Q1R086_9SOLA|nr:hypothetical protein K7X08_012296 [Anisodus acutangulus]